MRSRIALPAALRPAVLALLVLLSSCGGEPTRILVVVDAELALDSVYARTGEPGCSGCEHEFALAGEGVVTVPFSFVISPRDGDASREVRLLVEGRDGAGDALVTRTVRTRFVSGRTVLLHVLLEDACRGEPCSGGTTCLGGGCVDDTIDPATLPDVVPGRELERDGGTRVDGGTGVDGGDAGDAGTGSDAGEGGTERPRACGATDSGAITIDPDGAGPVEPFEVICDPSDGGGWVLIANVVAGESTLLDYDGPAWVGSEATADRTPGLALTDEGLFLPYWRTPVSQLRIVMIDDEDATMRARIFSLAPAPTTIRAAMDVPGTVRLSGRAPDWAALVGAGIGDGCAFAGIGMGMVRARIRIGALIPANASCEATSSAEAFFGVGAEVDGVGGCDVPMNSTGGATFCTSPPGGRLDYAAQALVFGRTGG